MTVIPGRRSTRRTNQADTTNSHTSYTIAAPGSYKYYRLDVTANNGHSWMTWLADLQLLESVALPVSGGFWKSTSATIRRAPHKRYRSAQPHLVHRRRNELGPLHPGPSPVAAGSSVKTVCLRRGGQPDQ